MVEPPSWKICSSNWIISPGRGENTKYLSCHHLGWEFGLELLGQLTLENSKLPLTQFQVVLNHLRRPELPTEHNTRTNVTCSLHGPNSMWFSGKTCYIGNHSWKAVWNISRKIEIIKENKYGCVSKEVGLLRQLEPTISTTYNSSNCNRSTTLCRMCTHCIHAHYTVATCMYTSLPSGWH